LATSRVEALALLARERGPKLGEEPVDLLSGVPHLEVAHPGE
jgi:hypothetical protein